MRALVLFGAVLASALSRRGSEVSGVVVITPGNATLKVTYDCVGLEPNVEGGTLHVHQGTSCNNIGEYYSVDNGPSPFVAVSYASDAQGVAKGSFFVSGLALLPLLHHVFAIHVVTYQKAVPTNGSCASVDLVLNTTVSSSQDCKNKCGTWQRSLGCGVAYFNPRIRTCELYKPGGCDWASIAGEQDKPNGLIFNTKDVTYSCASLDGNSTELVATFVVKRVQISSTILLYFNNVLDEPTRQGVKGFICQFIGDHLDADPVSCVSSMADGGGFQIVYLGVVLNRTIPLVAEEWSRAIQEELPRSSQFSYGTYEPASARNISDAKLSSVLVAEPVILADDEVIPDPPAMSPSTIAWIASVVSVVAFLAILCIVVFFCLRCKRKRQAMSTTAISPLSHTRTQTPPSVVVNEAPRGSVTLHIADHSPYVDERSPLRPQEEKIQEASPVQARKLSVPLSYYDSPASGGEPGSPPLASGSPAVLAYSSPLVRALPGYFAPPVVSPIPPPAEAAKSPRQDEKRLFKVSHNSYQASRILGKGKFGVAYLVTDEQGHQYVLKTLYCPNDVSRNEALKEAKALGHAPDSPHLLKQKDYWFDGDDFCMLINYCSGGSLEEQVHLKPGPAEVERILKELCEGLSVLHAANFIHRDLKPDNVFLSNSEDRTVVIGDMGMARRLAVDGFYDSKFGHMLYKAPEIAEGKYSRCSDMWSVGCIGLELLSGSTLTECYHDCRLVIGLCGEQERGKFITNMIGPHSSTAAYGIIRGLLLTAPENRLTADAVIKYKQAAVSPNDDYS